MIEAKNKKEAHKKAREYVTFDLDADYFDETIELEEVTRHVNEF